MSFAEENPGSLITALDKTQISISHNPQSYLLEKLKSHDIVLLGTAHKKPPILNLISALIPHLSTMNVTHLGLEITSDQQQNLELFPSKRKRP